MQEINLQYAPLGANPVVHVSQYDVGRQFRFKVYDGSTAYSMPNGTTARVEGVKPDGNAFSYADAVSVSGNVVTITTKQQMTLLSGCVKCEIRFSASGSDIGTINFILDVEGSPVNEDTPISDTELPTIIALAKEQEANAEAWARGTKNGVAVTSSEEQYHNNSKFYSEQSANSASASANSATQSANSSNTALSYANDALSSANTALERQKNAEAWATGERGGVAVGSNDETYHNNSKYYSQQSANSASASATSANNASNSEDAAKLSEQNAKASEDILAYYVNFVIPRFVIQNNRLYVSNAAVGEFIVANNRLYIKNAS